MTGKKKDGLLAKGSPVHVWLMPEDLAKLDYLVKLEPYNSRARVLRKLILFAFEQEQERERENAS